MRPGRRSKPVHAPSKSKAGNVSQRQLVNCDLEPTGSEESSPVALRPWPLQTPAQTSSGLSVFRDALLPSPPEHLSGLLWVGREGGRGGYFAKPPPSS